MLSKIIPVSAIILVLLTFFSIIPVEKAGAMETGMAGRLNIEYKALILEPGLDASIVGSNEFSPGSKSTIQISVQNNNIIDKLEAAASQGGVSQLYGAAVSLTGFLEKGVAPVTIKGGKILMGTLSSGAATPPIPFAIEIDEDAEPGEYALNLTLQYRMLNEVTKSGSSETVMSYASYSDAELEWTDKTQEIFLGIIIKEESLKFQVIDVNSQLRPGVRTNIKIEFMNSDKKAARDAEVELSANSPLTLTQNTAFLGTLQPADTAVGTFGIKVAGDAIPKEYSLDAVLKYRDISGNEYLTKAIKVPITVNSSFSLAQMINSTYISAAAGIVIGMMFMGIIWLIMRSRKRRS